MNILVAIIVLSSLELVMLLLLYYVQLSRVREQRPANGTLVSDQIGSVEIIVGLYHLPMLMITTRLNGKDYAPYSVISKLTFALYLLLYILTGQYVLAWHTF